MHRNFFSGDSGVSVPEPRPYDQIKQEVQKQVENGKYLLGNLVEKKEYTKFTIDTGSNLNKTSYTVFGRKIPLADIRKKLYNKHRQLGVLREPVTIFDNMCLTVLILYSFKCIY